MKEKDAIQNLTEATEFYNKGEYRKTRELLLEPTLRFRIENKNCKTTYDIHMLLILCEIELEKLASQKSYGYEPRFIQSTTDLLSAKQYRQCIFSGCISAYLALANGKLTENPKKIIDIFQANIRKICEDISDFMDKRAWISEMKEFCASSLNSSAFGDCFDQLETELQSRHSPSVFIKNG